ncbi:MAG: thymidine kinase [Chloroflexota bacterium]
MNATVLEPDIEVLWGEVDQITQDLDESHPLTTDGVVEYINKKYIDSQYIDNVLAEDFSITKPRIDYLRKQGILSPSNAGSGTQRRSWRYGPKDIRLALFAELLKHRYQLTVKDVKHLLSLKSTASLGSREHFSESEPAHYPFPLAGDMVLALLRNRVLSSLFLLIGDNKLETIPTGCLLTIRCLTKSEHSNSSDVSDKLAKESFSWSGIQLLLHNPQWAIAASYRGQTFYFYRSVRELLQQSPEFETELPSHEWYKVFLIDDHNELIYELFIGLSQYNRHSLETQAFIRAIQSHGQSAPTNANVSPTNQQSTIQLNSITGLSTLLKTAFWSDLSPYATGRTLHTLTKVITSALDGIDECIIFLPEFRDATAQLGEFPTQLIENASSGGSLRYRKEEISSSICGWAFSIGQPIYIDPTVDNDPRVDRFGIDKPSAAAAIPAVITEQDGSRYIVGVIYIVAKKKLVGEQVAEKERVDEEITDSSLFLEQSEGTIFTTEVKSALLALGDICGDIIARRQVEEYTVRTISHELLNERQIKEFDQVEELVETVLASIYNNITPDDIQNSWIYFVTIRYTVIRPSDPRLSTLEEWFQGTIIKIIIQDLYEYLENDSSDRPSAIYLSQVQHTGFVFGLNRPMTIPEEEFKAHLTRLGGKLQTLQIPGFRTDLFPWSVSLRVNHIYALQLKQGFEEVVKRFAEDVKNAVVSGPSTVKGHRALFKGRLDEAATQFGEALREDESLYLFKHLAEVRLLQGWYQDTIELCQKALELDSKYASARALLAESFFLTGEIRRAIQEFEQTLQDSTSYPLMQRADYLIKSGIAYASLSEEEYEQLIATLQEEGVFEHRKQNPGLRSEPNEYPNESTALFRTARDMLLEPDDLEVKDEKRIMADYHLRCGHAYLQAYRSPENVNKLNFAIEEFAKARRIEPDDQTIIQAHNDAVTLRRQAKSESPLSTVGQIEVITGCMFSGKTSLLIQRIEELRTLGAKVVIFHPKLQITAPKGRIRTHNNKQLEAELVETPQDILEFIVGTEQHIAIDEAQFFDESIVDVVIQLANRGKHLLIAGLDLDFRGVPFGFMPQLLACADKVYPLAAKCTEPGCERPAHFTQRTIDKHPAAFHEKTWMRGGEETYQPRCHQHHQVAAKPLHLTRSAQHALDQNPAHKLWDWAEQLEAIAQTGMHYAESIPEREQFAEVMKIAQGLSGFVTQTEPQKIEQILNEDAHQSIDDGYITPKIAVAIAAFNEDGKLLLIRRSDSEEWSLPGGWADVGYTPAENAIRELHQETGYQAAYDGLIGVYDQKLHPVGSLNVHAYTLLFHGTITNGKETLHREEVLQAEFFYPSEEELPTLKGGSVVQVAHAIRWHQQVSPHTYFDKPNLVQ